MGEEDKEERRKRYDKSEKRKRKRLGKTLLKAEKQQKMESA